MQKIIFSLSKCLALFSINAKWTFRWIRICKIRLLIGFTIDSAEMFVKRLVWL